MAVDQRNQLYDDFLREFPLESLKDMPLEKYTNLNRSDSFCYWLESVTYELGSIWGGTSYKFGIYKYANRPNNPTIVVSDDKYAWYKRYDAKDRNKAYQIVLTSIVKTAEAASQGRFADIDEDTTLGEVVRWKTAFLYSGKKLVPIYKRSMLEDCASALGFENAKKATIWKLQQFLMEQKGDRELFEYYEYLLTFCDEEGATVKYNLWNEAIIKVLGDNEKPLKATEIADEVLQSGYYHTAGKTPEKTISAQLTTNTKSYYNSQGGGFYTLSELGWQKYAELITDSEDVSNVKYWVYAPGDKARFWDECVANGKMYLGWDPLGDLSQYKSRKELKEQMKAAYGDKGNYTNDTLATYDFINNLKIGDVVFAKKGVQQIIGKGVVVGDYEYDDSRAEYKNVRAVKWEKIGEWKLEDRLATKTLTDITKYSDFVMYLESLVNGEAKTSPTKKNPTYTKADFLNDVYINEAEYDDLREILELKKNLILQGAPGVGKTFSAKRLAYSIMGEVDEDRIGFVQFHQNYSYEDFVMGYKPNSDGGFDLQKGIFYKFCIKAANNPDRPYFFIIDEINRGNLSKIFGELLMLIENNYRGDKISLAYNDERFAVPKNLYIIGMMNTADRSLAMIDYALRRRFSFFSMKPGFTSDGFKKYQAQLGNKKFDAVVEKIKELNTAIVADDSLGCGFEIGHSYFCNQTEITDAWLRSVVKYEIIPMLEEYWFDNKEKVNSWSKVLETAIQ